MTDSITAWLDNASRYPVLTPEQTILLARKIQAAEVGSAEHCKLVNKLCRHNLRLIVKFARGYMNGGNRKTSWASDHTLDLLQEGYFGLRRAACKFDPERGYTFATYASAWVRQAMGKYHVDKLSLIRVPESSAREVFYYETHGKPRNEKVAKWVKLASINAKNAYGLVSYDSKMPDGEHSMLSVLSEDNRLTDGRESATYDRVRCLMTNLGIKQQVQDVIVSYCKRGNLDVAMAKNKMSGTKTNRAMVRGSIALIKSHCAQ